MCGKKRKTVLIGVRFFFLCIVIYVHYTKNARPGSIAIVSMLTVSAGRITIKLLKDINYYS